VARATAALLCNREGPRGTPWPLLLALAVLYGIGWLLDKPFWLQVVATVSFAVIVGSWLALFWLPADCNAPYRTVPGTCDVRVRGLLRACNRPGHRKGKRQALLALLFGRPLPRRIGPNLRPQRAYSPPPSPHQQPAPLSREQAPWPLQEIPHRAMTLAIAALGTLATLIATAVELYMIARRTGG